MRIIEDDDEFGNIIGQYRYETMVVDFYTDWCPPCKMLSPYLEEMERKYKFTRFFKVNIELCPVVARTFQIETIPCIIIFHNAKEVKRVIGNDPETIEDVVIKVNLMQKKINEQEKIQKSARPKKGKETKDKEPKDKETKDKETKDKETKKESRVKESKKEKEQRGKESKEEENEQEQEEEEPDQEKKIVRKKGREEKILQDLQKQKQVIDLRKSHIKK